MSEKTIRNAVAGNPLLILFLGACPALGATATVQGALGMGAAVLAVMLFSGIVIAALYKAIPAAGRLPVSILVIAGFVSIVQMLMNAYLPNIYEMISIYLTVAAVDLLIFSNTKTADKGMGAVVSSAFKTGLQFLIVLLVMGLVREALGSASVWGMELAFLTNYSSDFFTKAPGGLLVFCFIAAAISKLCPGAAGIFGTKCEEVDK